MIQLVCSACQSQYELPDEDAGSEVQCACGQQLTVPLPVALAQSITAACGACGAEYEVPVEDAGTEAQCACGQLISIPKLDSEAPTDTSTMIPVTCSSCGSAYELGLDDAGTQVQCPCGKLIDVPSLDAAATNSPQQVAPSVEAIPITCPSCASDYQLGIEDAGTQVQCACGQTMTVPTLAEVASSQTSSPSKGRRQSKSSTSDSTDDDKATAKPDRDSAIPPREKKKKTSLLIPALIGMTVIASLVVAVMLNGSKPKQVAKNKAEQESRESTNTAGFKGITAWQSWVTPQTRVIVVIQPSKIADAPLFEGLPKDTILAMIRDNLGFELGKLDRVYSIENGGANTTWIVVGNEKLNKRHIHGTVLPDGEPITSKSLTWYKGNELALCFPDDKTAVISAVAEFPEKLAEINARKFTQLPIVEMVESSKVDAEIIVFASPGVLDAEDLPIPLEKSIRDEVESLTLMLNLTSSKLVSFKVRTKTEASAKQIEAKLQELRKLGQTQFKVLKDSMSAEIPDGAKLLEDVATKLVGSLTVYRNDNEVSMTLAAPLELAKALESAAPMLAELGMQEMLAGKSPDANPKDLQGQSDSKSDNKAGQVSQLPGGVEGSLNWPINPQEKFRSYEKAYDAFVKLYGQIDTISKEIPDAKETDKPALQQKVLLKQREAAGVLKALEQLSIRLAGLSGDREKLLQSRYLLAFMYSQLKLNYEAAMLAQWVAENDDPKNKRAIECAFISLLSWQATYQAARPVDRYVEREAFINIATLLNTRWPDNDKLDNIRYTVGQILQIADDAERSANWYVQVKPEAEKFADAQLAAGQGYWRGYLAKSKEARALEKQHPDLLVEPNISINAKDVPESADGPSLDTKNGDAPDNPEKSNSTEDAKPPKAETSDDADQTDSDQDENSKPDTPQEAAPTVKTNDDAATNDQTDESKEPDASPSISNDQESDDPRSMLVAISADMARLLKLAEQHLLAGIDLLNKSEAEQPTDSLVAGKVSLAHLYQKKSKHKEVLALLVEEPKPVLPAIAVEDESARPATGIKSQRFASSVWQIVLRSRVSLRQLEQAREAMEALEKVAGATDSSKLTAIYLSLGKELIGELESASPEDAAELRMAFVEFLNAVSKREQQTYGSLLWVGETCTALAESTDQEAEQIGFHTQAAGAWQSIIHRASEDRSFCSAQTVSAIRIRFAKSLSRSHQFEQSIKTFAGMLALQPNSFVMQFEAARTLQAWGEATEEKGHLLESINGLGDSIWGWGKTSISIQRLIASGKSKPEYLDQMLEARYQIAVARRAFAASQPADKRKVTLERALTEMRTTARLAASLEGEWWDKIDEQYQAIQTDLGIPTKSIRAEIGESQ
jgi:hypothetical protein